MNVKQVPDADKYGILEYSIIHDKIKCNLQLYWYQDSFLVIKKKMFEKVVESLNLSDVDLSMVKIHDKFYTLEWINYIKDVILRQTFNNFRFKLSKLLISYQIKDMYEHYEDSDSDSEPGDVASTALELYAPAESQALVKMQEKKIIKLEKDLVRLIDKKNFDKEHGKFMVLQFEMIQREIERIKSEFKENIENSTSRIIEGANTILSSLPVEYPNIHNILAYCNSKLIHVYFVQKDEDEYYEEYAMLEYHFKDKPYTMARYQYVKSLWLLDKHHLEYIKNNINASAAANTNVGTNVPKSKKPKEVKPITTFNQIWIWYEEYLRAEFSNFVVKIAENAIVGSEYVSELKHNLHEIEKAHVEFEGNVRGYADHIEK